MWWAIAKLHQLAQPSPELLGALEAAAVAASSWSKAQELSIVLWSIVTIGFEAQEASVQQLLNHFCRSLPHASSQNVANVLWACASLPGAADRGHLEVVQVRACELADQFKPQEVANALMAAAKGVAQSSSSLVQCMQRRAVELADSLNSQDVVSVALAGCRCMRALLAGKHRLGNGEVKGQLNKSSDRSSEWCG